MSHTILANPLPIPSPSINTSHADPTPSVAIIPHHAKPFFYPTRDFYWFIGGAFALCLFAHFIHHLKAERQLKRGRSVYTRDHGVGVRNDMGRKSDGMNSDQSKEKKRPGLIKQWTVELSNWLYLAIFPSWMYAPETGMDAIWTGIYCAGMAFCCVYDTPSIPGDPYPYRRLANKCGCMAYAQTPIVFLLAVKNNPLQPLLGITYQKLNYLHRASARACIFASWLHTALWVLPLWENSMMLEFYVIMGYIALAGFTGLWFMSIRLVRRRAFELFLVAHIVLSLAFIIGGCLHWPLRSHWIWPSFLVWAADRCVRVGKRLRNEYIHRSSWRHVGACKIELVGKDVMRVSAQRMGLKWQAGQHFFISSPAIPSLPHESHPFSISNVPASYSQNEAIFLIRAHSGFTRSLKDLLPDIETTSIPLHFEGPYGHCHRLDNYESVLLVAGGTGVTFCLSYLLGLLRPFSASSTTTSGAGGAGGAGGAVRDMAETRDTLRCVKGGDAGTMRTVAGTGVAVKSLVRRIKMVWHVRHVGDVKWIAPMLNQALDDVDEAFIHRGERGERGDSSSASGQGLNTGMRLAGQEIRIEIDIYVTRSKRSAEPWMVPSVTIPPTPSESGYNTGTATPVRGNGRSVYSSHSYQPSQPSMSHANASHASTSHGSHGSLDRVGLPHRQPGSAYEGSSAEGMTSPYKRGRYMLAELDLRGVVEAPSLKRLEETQELEREQEQEQEEEREAGGAGRVGPRSYRQPGKEGYFDMSVKDAESSRGVKGSGRVVGGQTERSRLLPLGNGNGHGNGSGTGTPGSSYSATSITSRSNTLSPPPHIEYENGDDGERPNPIRSTSKVRFGEDVVRAIERYEHCQYLDEGRDGNGARGADSADHADDADGVRRYASGDTGTWTRDEEDGDDIDILGLSPRVRTCVRVFAGRADLGEIVPRMADGLGDESGSENENENEDENGDENDFSYGEERHGAESQSSGCADLHSRPGPGPAFGTRNSHTRDVHVQGDMIVVTCGPVPLMHDARRAVWGANSGERVRGGRRVVELLEETVGQ